MTKEELAGCLHGIKCPVHRYLETWRVKEAKEAGLVIVYGSSDDIMCLSGAIDDEVDCYDGGTGLVDGHGLLNRSLIDDDDDEAIAKFVARKEGARAITAEWSPDAIRSWAYKTDIPHATFDAVDDDGSIYCTGIVFSLQDVKDGRRTVSVSWLSDCPRCGHGSVLVETASPRNDLLNQGDSFVCEDCGLPGHIEVLGGAGEAIAHAAFGDEAVPYDCI